MGVKPWEVSDAFWARVEPLIPPPPERDPGRPYKRAAGAGRKRKPARLVFEAIVYVLRTGCQWKALPKARFGSPSSVHRYFLEWEGAGFFRKLWEAGLAECDDMEGVAWLWQGVDGATAKAPTAAEAAGPSPVDGAEPQAAAPASQAGQAAGADRGKKWGQAAPAGGRPWGPALDRRGRGGQARRELG